MSGLILPGLPTGPDPKEIERNADRLRLAVEATGALAMVIVLTVRNGGGAWTVSGPPGISMDGRAMFAHILRQVADFLAPPRVAPLSPHDWETI